MRTYDDPRDTITPASFAVAPELIGTPLATPARRAFAMAIDLVLAGVLSQAGFIGLAIIAAVLLLRQAAGRGSTLKRTVRVALVVAAVAAIAFAAIRGWRAAVTAVTGGQDGGSPGVVTGLSGALGVLGDAAALQRAETEEEAQRIATRLVHRFGAGDIPEQDLEDIRQELRDAEAALATDSTAPVAGMTLRPMAVRALRDALAAVDSTAPTTAAAADTASAGPMADSLARLERRIASLRRQNEALGQELDEASQRGGFRYFLSELADDMGLGAAWLALYFTAFVVLWKGKTPGKWVTRVRVVRLDGLPLGWWQAFERFGGYSASLATLGVGFLQILWDRNRQGIHDKLVETVVIQE